MAVSPLDYEKTLTGEIAAALQPAVAALPGSGDVAGLMDGIATRLDRMMAAATPKPPAQKLLTCRAGCDFCCHQFEVHVSALEALRLADHVRASFDAARRAALLARIDAFEAKRANVEARAAAFHRLPCPLLEDGRCGVYAVRSFVCRSVTSYDVGPCQTRNERPGGAVAIPAHAGIQAMGRAAKAAFLAASESAPGGGGILDLARALKAALALADATARWIRGERIFEGAGARVAPQVVKNG